MKRLAYFLAGFFLIAGCLSGAASVKLVISWECDSAPTEYRIYEKVGTAWTLVKAVTEKTYSMTGVAAGTHTYKVAAVYSFGELDSEPVSVDVPSNPRNATIAIVIQ